MTIGTANKIVTGYAIAVGLCTAHFVYKAVNDKADELMEHGGMFNAFSIGTGQFTVAGIAGYIAYEAVQRFIKGIV